MRVERNILAGDKVPPQDDINIEQITKTEHSIPNTLIAFRK